MQDGCPGQKQVHRKQYSVTTLLPMHILQADLYSQVSLCGHSTTIPPGARFSSPCSLSYALCHPTGHPGLRGQHILHTQHVKDEQGGSGAFTWTKVPNPALPTTLPPAEFSAELNIRNDHRLKISYPKQGFLITMRVAFVCVMWVGRVYAA